MKNVQIPESLFFDLCRFHLQDPIEDEAEAVELLESIEAGLKDKLEAMRKRAAYSAYKDRNLTPEQREDARKAYLDLVGMLPDYRWSSLEPPV